MTYARLKHDFQWMSYKSRTVTPGWPGLPTTPETVPLFTSPKGGKDDVKLSEDWLTYLKQLNSDRGYKFIISPAAGWFNRNKLADSLGFGGNVVQVTGISNGSAQIKTFAPGNKPPAVSASNYESHPELIQKFTAITSGGQVVNPANDIDVYTFIIGKGALYVPLNRLEFFPTLPIKVSVGLTKAFGLEIKETPSTSSKTVGKVPALGSTEVIAYSPSGSNVWGRVNKGWIPLLLYPKNGTPTYYTSWKMKTVPAPAPRS